VDFSDFNNLANNYTGTLAPGIGGKEWHNGDFDGDGDVDFADFNELANHYTGAGVDYTAGKAAVPEPSTWLMLLSLGMAALTVRGGGRLRGTR
jgi:hypothetical protein